MTATATPPAGTPAPGTAVPLRPHDPTNIVEVDDLKVHFPIRAGIFKSVKGSVKAVDGVTIEVRRGETLGLVGESGLRQEHHRPGDDPAPRRDQRDASGSTASTCSRSSPTSCASTAAGCRSSSRTRTGRSTRG